jgi:hypothetical protein
MLSTLQKYQDGFNKVPPIKLPTTPQEVNILKLLILTKIGILKTL